MMYDPCRRKHNTNTPEGLVISDLDAVPVHQPCMKGLYDTFFTAIAIPGQVSAADLYEHLDVWVEEFKKKGFDKRDLDALRGRCDEKADIKSMSMKSGIPATRIQKMAAFVSKCQRAGIADTSMDVMFDHDINEDSSHRIEPFPFFPAA